MGNPAFNTTECTPTDLRAGGWLATVLPARQAVVGYPESEPMTEIG